MKFYGKGFVWDKENNRLLCRFSRSINHQNGELETKDERVINILKDLGYKYEGEELCQSKDVNLTEKAGLNGEKKESATPTKKATRRR